MNKKIIGILSLILIIAGIIFASSYAGQDNSQKPTIKIGATLPLTGDVAVLGQSSKKAIELALKDLGDTKYNYEVIFEDDAFKTQQGATTANKLITIDKVDVLFSFGSPVGNVVSPIAESQKVPHINFFASDTKVANGIYNFLHYTPPYVDTELFVKELNKRGITKIDVFEIADNPGAAAISEALEKSIKNTNIQIVAHPKFNTGTRDFRTLIQGVKDSGAEIYVLQSSSPELETLYMQMRELGITTPVTSIETFEFANDLSLFEGSWYVNSADPQQWFVDAFVSKHNETPKFGAAHAYDALNLIVQVVEKIGDGKNVPTHAEIRKGLDGIKSFDGALGDNLKFDQNGQLISGAVVREVRDGKPVTISQ